MAKFLFQGGYTSQSWKAQVAKPASPIDRIAPLAKACGGQVDAVYYAFGDEDIVAIVELPDAKAAATFALAVASGGAMRSFKTTPLLTVEEGTSAMKKVADASKHYNPPIDLGLAEKARQVVKA